MQTHNQLKVTDYIRRTSNKELFNKVNIFYFILFYHIVATAQHVPRSVRVSKLVHLATPAT
jgi:hypothetical protein